MKKTRIDDRPTLSEGTENGSLGCKLCDQRKKWAGGGFTRHLKTQHDLSVSEYYLKFYGEKWKLCLCGCGKETAWEPREGYYKGYISGHNFRGKTKETTLAVKLRAGKMIKNVHWQKSTFKKGNIPWNKHSTDIEYLRKLFESARRYTNTSSIKRGIYTSTKSGEHFRYDSGWELERMKHYDSEPSVISWKRCQDIIPYFDANGQKRHHNPDFLVNYGNEKITIEEVKGALFGEASIPKIKAAYKHYSDIGYEYIVITKRNLSFIQVPLNLFFESDNKQK